MKHIVLGIDDSVERATEEAQAVLDLFDGSAIRAHLLHSFVDEPDGASVTGVTSVKRTEELFEEAGVEVELHESSGDPAASILKTAEELDADAIVVAGRKRTPAGKALFGSVSQSVILGTDRPVIVCGEPNRSE